MRTLLALLVGGPLAGCVINGGSESPPVQLAVGAPDPIGFETTVIQGAVHGVVRHEVCVAADDTSGYVIPTALVDVGSYGPVDGAPLQSSPFDDLDCPDDPAMKGWARIAWDTVTGRGLITLEHSATRGTAAGGDGSAALDPDAGEWVSRSFASGSQTLLQGLAFEGYDVTAQDLQQVGADTWSLPLHVDYRATGDLPATPAANLTVSMIWQPLLDPSAIVGGSPGLDAENGTFATDVHGDAYVFLSGDALCYGDVVLFATTPDGGTALVTTLTCP